MSNNAAKMISTFFLLAAVTGVSMTAIIVEVGDFAAVLVIAIFLLATLIFGLSIIWVMPERMRAKYGPVGEEQSPEKAKRGSRREEQLALLLDLMDDEELAAFKESLKRRVLADSAYEDGELPFAEDTLESLLEDASGSNRRHRGA